MLYRFFNLILQRYNNYFMKKRVLTIIFAALICAMNFICCTNEEKYSSSDKINLQFSTDTLAFDTIFTTIGSVTKQIHVFNPENEPIKLDYITLGSGQSSFFRLNVDGDTSIVAKDVVIGAKDSIFIFVRIELDANNTSNPLLIEDSVLFAFNGKMQSVLLTAYGQDAYYHKPTHTLNIGESKIPYCLANEGGEEQGVSVSGNYITWKKDKPHVIIGTCVVDSAYTLNLEENTLIHLGNNADFWVYSGGTLKANGTTTNPVVFQSLRTQDRYSDIPGQWGKIWLWSGSKDNVLENVVIKNATIGLLADTCVNNNHTVELKNTRIENCSSIGLYARGADIYAENLLVQNCGSYCVAASMGGRYEFIGCTFANYWSFGKTRTDAVLILNDWYEATDGNVQERKIEKCDFHNTIIYGSMYEDEVELDLLKNLGSNYSFDHCLIKSAVLKNNNQNIKDCIFNQDPLFENVSENDLHLQDSSPAIGKGNGIYNSTVPYDIFGTYRLDPPCIGAIENRNKVSK